MSRRLDVPRAAPLRAAVPVRTLTEKAAWIERHSPMHASALSRIADYAMIAIDDAERARLKRKRPA
jgi:hypothetical protein